MKYRLQKPIRVVALILAGVFPWSRAGAQTAAPVSLQEQLNAQYKLARLATDSSGTSVVDPGTLLAVQKGGILGVGPNSIVICPAKYQDGNLHSPNGLCVAMVKNSSRNFQVGEKVYPTKIDVNLKNDRIGFFIVACDSCNGTNPPSYYKSEVSFQFAKGTLATANAAQIEDTIGQVLAIDSGGIDQSASGSQSDPAQPAPPSQQTQAPPQTIQLGETQDQVVAAFGQPEKIVNLGARQIYVYKDLKVTFVNNKVSDVQ